MKVQILNPTSIGNENTRSWYIIKRCDYIYKLSYFYHTNTLKKLLSELSIEGKTGFIPPPVCCYYRISLKRPSGLLVTWSGFINWRPPWSFSVLNVIDLFSIVPNSFWRIFHNYEHIFKECSSYYSWHSWYYHLRSYHVTGLLGQQASSSRFSSTSTSL